MSLLPLRLNSECSLGTQFCSVFLRCCATLFDTLSFMTLCQRFVVPLLCLHYVCNRSIGIPTQTSRSLIPQIPTYISVILWISNTEIQRGKFALHKLCNNNNCISAVRPASMYDRRVYIYIQIFTKLRSICLYKYVTAKRVSIPTRQSKSTKLRRSRVRGIRSNILLRSK